jgi:diaminopimelate decarboxylase
MCTLISPERWGVRASSSGELMVENHGVVALAEKYGTPLHLVHERRLVKTAVSFSEHTAAAYPGRVAVYYALKCNSVPAVVEAIRSAGLNAEVMTEYELDLAVHLGFTGRQIIVNGPCKTDKFLLKCIDNGVRLIIVDSTQELSALDTLARRCGTTVDILLRINPGYVPRNMNDGTATGSRRCAFGFNLKSGEASSAFTQLKSMHSLRFLGLHMHIGTGIREPSEYARALRRLGPVVREADNNGLTVRILDVGGGFASMTTREFRTGEMLAYQGFGRLPQRACDEGASIDEFARTISLAVQECFTGHELPELLYEPGRCIASPNQFLLLTVHRSKTRKGIGTWLITDGGLSTVTLPTYYEQHELLLCNDITRPCTERVTLIGPGCFAGDIIYSNKLMPHVHPGEIIAIMDSGAYFTALESSFGFPRPAILAINGADCRLIRARETYEDMVRRDIFDEATHHEIRNHKEQLHAFAG